MDTFQILSTMQITMDDKIKLNSVTFDGEYFYFTELKRNRIYKYSFALEFISYYETKRVYRSICYDKKEDCFWASISKYSIIKLDRCLKEIDMFTINCYDKSFGHTVGIHYDFGKNKLLVAYNSAIVEISKSKDTEISVKQKEHDTFYYSALGLEDCYVCTYVRNNYPAISVFDNHDQLMIQCCLPVEYYVKDMTLGYDEADEEQFIYVLASKQGDYSCLIKCRLISEQENFADSECFDECDCEEDDHNKYQVKEFDDKEFDDKEFDDQEFDDKGLDDKEFDDKESDDQGSTEEEYADKKCDHKDYGDKKCCDGECCSNDCSCKKLCDVDENYSNVIESVALLQTSLAHMLDIEAEEIQKMLACSSSADEILEVNDAVRSNITRALHLEQLLFTILDSSNEMLKKALKT